MWLRACLFTCWVVCSPAWLHAQFNIVIKGSVRDSVGRPLPQATLLLKDTAGLHMLGFAITRADGSFVLRQTLLSASVYRLEAGHVQYQVQARPLFLSPADSVYPGIDFQLSGRVTSLDEVVIRAKPPAFTVRGDTTEFRASAYRTAESRKVEDLLRQIPGFDIAGDGRISFNGKEVDRILVEGDDLTEKNYRLLSRNLQAGLVDKVQVMSRYDENRLMATVSNSEKVGINLTIDKKYMQRWSGTLEAGLGTGGERMADISLVRLAPAFKFIQFLQHNTIGLTANADMNHYFREGEAAGASSSQEIPARGLLKAGSILPPPLGASYTRNNNDQSGFSILSWKAGPGARMKVLAGGLKSGTSFLSRGWQDILQPDGYRWQVSFEDASRSDIQEGLLRYSFQHDAGKNNLGSYVAELALGHAVHQYANLSAGAITDSLREKLLTRQVFYHLRGSESFRLAGAAVLHVLFSARRDKPEQVFDAATGRFRGYFMLDSSFLFFRQELPANLDRGEADITISDKRKKVRWSAGLRTLLERISYRDVAMARQGIGQEDSLLRKGETGFRSWRNTVYGSLQIPGTMKGEWGLGLAIGHGQAKASDAGVEDRADAFIYRMYAGYTRFVSPMRQFSVRLQSAQDMPATNLFHPPGLLSGQGTVLDGARDIRFSVTHSLQASYLFNNLQRGSNWLVMASAGTGNRQYNTALEANPAYVVMMPLATDGNRNLSLQLKGERYVKSLRSKFSLQLSGMYLEDRMAYNGLLSRNRAGNLRFQPRWASAFRGRFNGELSITSWYTRNMTVPDSGLSTRFSQWQHQGYAKIRLTFSERLFMAVQYNGYRLSEGSLFQSLDAYVKWTIGTTWSLALYGHNLLQSRVIEQRQFSVNAQYFQSFVLVPRYVMARVQWQF